LTRRRLTKASEDGGRYFFASTDSQLQFVHTGSTTLDMVLGGGWPLGRVINVIGDNSSGKTLLAIEGMANFALQYPKGKIRYREPEAAFLPEYAGALGLPLDRGELTRGDGSSGPDTVEKFYNDLDRFLKKLKGNPGMYVLDSLDALSDEAELNRGFGEASYGTGKAKDMSQMFRLVTSRIEESRVCLLIISQTRDRIGVTFGRKYTRSGGRALDFYASIILYLAHIKEISRTVEGVKRPVGVQVKAKCTKNKVGLPFRSCEFPIIFGYGIEDISAGLDWLAEHKRLGLAGLTEREYKDLKKLALRTGFSDSEKAEIRKNVSTAVRKGWLEVEKSFLPKQGKYV
jgi:recombination protein RecA